MNYISCFVPNFISISKTLFCCIRILIQNTNKLKTWSNSNCTNTVSISFSLLLFLQRSCRGLLDKDCKWLYVRGSCSRFRARDTVKPHSVNNNTTKNNLMVYKWQYAAQKALPDKAIKSQHVKIVTILTNWINIQWKLHGKEKVHFRTYYSCSHSITNRRQHN